MPKITNASHSGKTVTLKILAEFLNLSLAEQLLDHQHHSAGDPAACAGSGKKNEYRLNLNARSLRTKHTNTVGVIVPQLSEGYFVAVMMGVEEHLLQEGFLYFTVSHLWRPDLMEEYPKLLMNRAVDGFLLVNTELQEEVPVPVVGISSHSRVHGVTNVELDHIRGARMALRHLYDLGHRRIAFMKGQRYSLDSESRWQSIVNIAREIGIVVRPELCIYLEKNFWSPELGYPPVRELLARTHDFTAIFCFNDTAAIGAIRAIQDVGLECPRDISVIGFDDIISAAYHSPRLTTIRQPLHQMGWTSAQLLLNRIQAPNKPYPEVITFEPELVVRESTAGLPRRTAKKQPRTKQQRGRPSSASVPS